MTARCRASYSGWKLKQDIVYQGEIENTVVAIGHAQCSRSHLVDGDLIA